MAVMKGGIRDLVSFGMSSPASSISWGREDASSMALALPGSPMAFKCL